MDEQWKLKWLLYVFVLVSAVRIHLVDQIVSIILQVREHASPDLEYYLYDRLLQILLKYFQDDDYMVGIPEFILPIIRIKYWLHCHSVHFAFHLSDVKWFFEATLVFPRYLN